MAEAWSKKPKPKVDVKPPQNNINSTDLIGKTRLWFDLIHLALQTDSTRLITLQLLGTSGVPPIQGVSQGHHDLSHHGQDPAKIAQLKMLEMEKMKTLRDFLAKLKQTHEGGRKLARPHDGVLQQQPGRRPKHSRQEHARAVGRRRLQARPASGLRPEQDPPPLCNLFVSMLQRMGIEADKFGSSTGTLTGLEV